MLGKKRGQRIGLKEDKRGTDRWLRKVALGQGRMRKRNISRAWASETKVACDLRSALALSSMYNYSSWGSHLLCVKVRGHWRRLRNLQLHHTNCEGQRESRADSSFKLLCRSDT